MTELHRPTGSTGRSGSGPSWRERVRSRFKTESFDIAIVGGGITGAGIARDATLRGLRVALLEAEDFASGTSSRSSRLIHGGVRYLEHGHLHLVFESSRERRTLLRIAPHLVRPLAFTWPVYAGARVSRARLGLGLGLYDLLSMFRNVSRHERLTSDRLIEQEPQLRRDGLLGGARYYDASTDDSRLTLANVIAAAEAGAAVFNHARVTGFEVVNGRVRGLTAHDAVAAESFVVRAATVVNATGPWSDELRALEAPVERASVTGSRGTHIAVPRARVGNRQAITMLHPSDGRVMFTLPAGDQTIIGTTETPVATTDRESRASRADVAYLLEAANGYFPGAKLTARDVVAAWSGIRPLAQQLATDDVGSASREHTITRGAKGVVHVTGGKLTTYREMASQVVNSIAAPGTGADHTSELPLPGGDRPVDELTHEASDVILDVDVRDRLIGAYGSRWRDVWALGDVDARLRERITPDHAVIRGEVVYAVEQEMAVTLGDLLIRRTHVAFQFPDQGQRVAPLVADLVAPLSGWSSADREDALSHYERELKQTFAIES
jgi:glycerol-3-phosphate dehydrogenase